MLRVLDPTPRLAGTEARLLVQRPETTPAPRVTVEPPPAVVRLSDALTLEARIADESGRPAAGASVEWTAAADTAGGLPLPGFPAFSTGRSMSTPRPAGASDHRRPPATIERGGVARADEDGRVRVTIPPASFGGVHDRLVQGKFRVVDAPPAVSTAGWSTAGVAGDVRVGVRLDRVSVSLGEPLAAEARVVGARRGPAPAVAVRLAAAPAVWDPDEERWRATETTASCAGTSRDEPLRCALAAARAGPWVVTATATDPAGRTSEASRLAWVVGDEPLAMLDGPLPLPDGTGVRAGASASVRLAVPEAAPYALWLVGGGGGAAGIARLAGGSARVELPMPDVGDRRVRVELAPLVGRTCGPWKPLARVQGLPIGWAFQELEPRRLEVAVGVPAGPVAPGDEVDVEVVLPGPGGAPRLGVAVVAWIDAGARGAALAPTVADRLGASPARAPAWWSTRALEPCPPREPRHSELLLPRPTSALFGTPWGERGAGGSWDHVRRVRVRPLSGLATGVTAPGGAKLKLRAPAAPGAYVVHVVAVDARRPGEGRAGLVVGSPP